MATDVRILPEWIHPITGKGAKPMLGESAFHTVEQCLYKPPGSSEGRVVAVKRMRHEMLANDEEFKAFTREAKLVSQLNHTNVVQYIGVGGKLRGDPGATIKEQDSLKVETVDVQVPAQDADNMPVTSDDIFIVEELMAGGTLFTKLHLAMEGFGEDVVYSNADALRWARHMAGALQYLHGLQPMVIHRNLNPENILLTDKVSHKAVAKVGDFALSKLLPNRERMMSARSDPSLTATESKAKDLEAEWTQSLKESWKGRSGSGLPQLKSVTGSKQNTSTRSSVGVVSGSGGSGPRMPAGSLRFALGLRLHSKSSFAGGSSVRSPGRTGTFMYMAPEVFKLEASGPGADVFAYAVILYEMFSRELLIAHVTKEGSVQETEVYARSVSTGYRPPLNPKVFRGGLDELLALCWTQDPAKRPTMTEILKLLDTVEATGELQAMDSMCCGCQIS